jgi:hypothetical protein
MSAAVAAAAAQVGPGQVTPPYLVETPLNGSLQGSYTSHAGPSASGTTLGPQGSGQVTPLGRVSVAGSIAIPGFNFDVQSSGTLTLRDARGTLTLKVSGATATRSGKLPDTLSYTTVSGTGAYVHLYDTGTLRLSLDPSTTGASATNPGHGRFSLTLTSSHTVTTNTASTPTNTDDLTTAQASTIDLAGKAKGLYTSTQGVPDTGTHYQLTASGTITPIGSAVVSGSFQTPGFIRGGVATGTLTLAGKRGTLTLKLTEAGPIPSGNAATATPSNGPIILLNNFAYQITGGTGQYAHAQGSGTVAITATPGLSHPTGPGVYNAASLIQAGFGRTTLTFTPGFSPLG